MTNEQLDDLAMSIYDECEAGISITEFTSFFARRLLQEVQKMQEPVAWITTYGTIYRQKNNLGDVPLYKPLEIKE